MHSRYERGILKVYLGVCALSAALSLAAAGAHAFGRPRPQEPGPTPAFALGDVVANGSGCLAPRVELSEDRREIRIGSDSFAARTDSASGRTLDRKTCSVVIPVLDVPRGYQLRLTETLAEGSYVLEAGASARITEDAFLSGSAGERAERVLGSEGADTAGEIRERLAAGASLGCGETGAFRANAALMVQGSQALNARPSEARLSALTLHLDLVACP